MEMMTKMDIRIALTLLSTVILLCITIGGIVWRLAEKVSTLSTKLDGHIESTKEWRTYMIGIINGRK